MNKSRRVYVRKRAGLNQNADKLTKMLVYDYGITSLKLIEILNVYDVWGLEDNHYQNACETVFSEPNTDEVFFDDDIVKSCDRAFRVQLIQGQFDQRADSANKCIYALTMGSDVRVVSSVVYKLYGDISEEEFEKIKSAIINPVESVEADLFEAKYELGSKPQSFVEYIDNFTNKNKKELQELIDNESLTLSIADLEHCQKYFLEELKRNPTKTELKVLDTYWSDHCRHTTFMTNIDSLEIEDGKYSKVIKETWENCKKTKMSLGKNSDLCLMDLATLEMKEQLSKGELRDKEDTDEINACSLEVDVDIDGKDVPYLVLFKNETHNHPTEIEPYGGAATCLGGAIRDPLSGRGFVYQSMRITGSADPRTPLEDTWEGKLPQRRITTEAARGFSSYGNQIGLATGHVTEVYNKGFMAKRMEVGAVVGAVPKNQVVREIPQDGDIVILVGGATGRDGIGGATGSSKSHTADSLATSGAEVQKGNPVEERKLQRLFRNPDVSMMIKRSNDFGAGGVSVAIGELADSLDIYLQRVPLKYEGLTGMEIALSESQERMAVVIDKKDEQKFIQLAKEENLTAIAVAKVTDTGKLRLFWEDNVIFDIDRWFIDTSGVTPHIDAKIKMPKEKIINQAYKNILKSCVELKLEESSDLALDNDKNDILYKLKNTLSNLNVASQKGLVENFDATIGKNTVLMPLGGKNQITPVQGMVAKIPTWGKNTNIGTVMTFGYSPSIAELSPFHGGYYSVIESIAKSVAIGAGYEKIRLSMQEYFPRLGDDPNKWGMPIAGLLGAYKVQNEWGIPAIGGKDSMSGTFKDVDVPPTVISFAFNIINVNDVISPEFKNIDSDIVLYIPKRNDNELLNAKSVQNDYDKILKLMKNGIIKSAMAIESGGSLAGIAKMSFGNEIGVKLSDNLFKKFDENTVNNILFGLNYGGLILEVDAKENIWKSNLSDNINFNLENEENSRLRDSIFITVGKTTSDNKISYTDKDNIVKSANIMDLMNTWTKPLDGVFPVYSGKELKEPKYEYKNILFDTSNIENKKYREIINNIDKDNKNKILSFKNSKPKAFIPIFAGTNCEDDTTSSLIKAGAEVNSVVFKNATSDDMKESVNEFIKAIENSQIIVFSGGFSAGDEPDGSGKFIASVFRHPKLSDALMKHLYVRDGLILGICNGFQALVKLGLLPYGKIKALDSDSPTLTYNTIGRHISRISPIRVTSNLSPWLSGVKIGSVYQNVFSHGEGRFLCSDEDFVKLRDNGQIATQYVNIDTKEPTMDEKYNINGSSFAIEGICSPDGRVFGKMGHVERIGDNLYKNIPDVGDMKIFESGVNYFK